jgi:hypothetical protein
MIDATELAGRVPADASATGPERAGARLAPVIADSLPREFGHAPATLPILRRPPSSGFWAVPFTFTLRPCEKPRSGPKRSPASRIRLLFG